MTGPRITHAFTSAVPDSAASERVQPSAWDADHVVDLGAALAAIFALTPAADRLPYFTDANNAALTTFTASARTLLAGASMPAILTALGAIAKAGDTMTGALTLAGDPTVALHAATKQYVDNVVAGLDPKPSAKYATAAALATNTYAAGVLTASANGALAVDGFSPVAADRILVKNEATAANNGIYVVTAAGDSTHPFVLTRAADMAAWSQVPGASILVEQGTANADTGWICTSDQTGTLGTTAITWGEFFGTGVFQPNNANLTALAGLTGAANKVPSFTGAGAMALLAINLANGLVQLDGSARLPNVDGSQLTNLPLTPSGIDGFINKLRNSSLASWFHGTAINVTTSGGWGAEGVYVVPTGATVAVNRVSNGLANPRTVHAMQIVGATSVTDVVARFVVESFDAAQLAGKQVTFQIPVLNNTGGSITPTITVKRANAQDASYTNVDVSAVSLQTIANGSTGILAYSWAAPAGTINGLSINIDFGNNFSSNAKSIQIGGGFDLRVTPGLTTGTVGTPSDPEIRDHTSDHNWNMRFFEASYENGTAPGTATHNGLVNYGYNAATTSEGGNLAFRINKRATPTMSYWDGAGGANLVSFFTLGAWSDAHGDISSLAGLSTVVLALTSSAAHNLYGHFTADATLVGA